MTNGTFINQRYIELLKPFQTNFQITIDGDKDSHNAIRKFKIGRRESYGLILKGLKMLNEADADFYYTIRVESSRYQAISIGILTSFKKDWA